MKAYFFISDEFNPRDKLVLKDYQLEISAVSIKFTGNTNQYILNYNEY